MTEKFLTPRDLAERYDIPVGTVYQWNTRGGGPKRVKIGVHVRYKLADVEAWERSRYVDSNGGGEAA